MRPAGYRVEQAGQQRGHHLGAGRRGRRAAPLGVHVGHDREGQRVAPGERQGVRVRGFRYPQCLEQLPALRRVQVGQRHRADQAAPARVDPPVQRRRLPAGQHRDGARRQRGQQVLGQPLARRADLVDRVDDQQQVRRVQRAGEARHQPAAGRRLAAVHPHHPAPGVPAQPGDLAQQRRLAHAARPAHVDDPAGVGGGQQRLEQAQFGPAADERAPAGRGELIGEGGGHVMPIVEPGAGPAGRSAPIALGRVRAQPPRAVRGRGFGPPTDGALAPPEACDQSTACTDV